MALQIWLPLNKEGEFNSKGLMSNSFNLVGSPSYTLSGKIGGCYVFDGVDDGLYSATDKNKYWNGKEISYSCWFKCDKIKSSGTLIEIGADLCISYTYNSSGIRFGYWRCYSNNGTRTGDTKLGSTYYSADNWNHIVFTIDHQYNTLYVNGELSQVWDSSDLYTTNWSALLSNTNYKNIAIGRSYGSTSFIGGSINDIRIYDHCLSKKEIKELSKGLILHYPLNDVSTLMRKCGNITWNQFVTFVITHETGHMLGLGHPTYNSVMQQYGDKNIKYCINRKPSQSKNNSAR